MDSSLLENNLYKVEKTGLFSLDTAIYLGKRQNSCTRNLSKAQSFG